MIGGGVAGGVVLAAALVRVAASLIEGIGAVGTAACYVPAPRTIVVNQSAALRAE